MSQSIQQPVARPLPPIKDRRVAPPALIGLTVVTPLFNERECIDMLFASLDGVEHVLRGQYDLEFLLIDDGSSDGTLPLLRDAVATRNKYRILQHKHNRGIAAAIQTGIRAARHEIVISLDCDGSYDPLLIKDIAPLLTDGVDLVTASPYHPEGRVENVPEWRLCLSRFASRLYGLACRHRLTCYTCCFRAYRKSSVALIELENERFVGVAELLWKVLEQGGRVVEHPALLRSRAAGQSKMRVIRAALGHLRLIAKIARRRIRRGANPALFS
jgi:dolichol-phosphate mannosyltransferase